MVEDFGARRDHLPIPAEKLLASPCAFVDSAGTLHVGQDMSLHLAKVLARQHSGAVLARCDEELRRWRKALVTGFLAEGSWPDTECHIKLKKAAKHLAELEAVEHLLRDWCGHGQAVRIDEAHLMREDNERLHRLIDELAHWLVASGHPSKATWLRRQLR